MINEDLYIKAFFFIYKNSLYNFSIATDASILLTELWQIHNGVFLWSDILYILQYYGYTLKGEFITLTLSHRMSLIIKLHTAFEAFTVKSLLYCTNFTVSSGIKKLFYS